MRRRTSAMAHSPEKNFRAVSLRICWLSLKPNCISFLLVRTALLRFRIRILPHFLGSRFFGFGGIVIVVDDRPGVVGLRRVYPNHHASDSGQYILRRL